MSVQVVYKNSKKIANSKIQAIFIGENFAMIKINSLSKLETETEEFELKKFDSSLFKQLRKKYDL